MKEPRAILLTVLPFFLLVLLVQACANPAPTRQLLSVTISPTSGTAPGSPAQVQFIATGTYNTKPYTVTPLTANWGVQSYPQAIAITDQTGLATCKQDSSGTTTIEAWVQLTPSVCNVIDSAGRPACDNVWGSAQLTCQ